MNYLSFEEEERLKPEQYRPQRFIEDYTHPYPKYELVRARETLIRHVFDWSKRGGTSRLKAKLGLPETVDEQVLVDLKLDKASFSTPVPLIGRKSLDPYKNEEDVQSRSSSAKNSSRLSSSTKRKSDDDDDVVFLGITKKARQDDTPVTRSSTASHTAVKSNTKKDAADSKRAISPIRLVDSGSSTLSISSLNSSKASKSTEKSMSRSATSLATRSGPSAAAGTSADFINKRDDVISETKKAASSVQTSFKSNGPTEKSSAKVTESKSDEGIYDVLKCDYCRHTEDISYRQKMMSHLVSLSHCSASVYSVRKKGDDIELCAVKQQVAVCHKSAVFKSLFVKCPDCLMFFGDVFQCGMHYRYNHSHCEEKFMLVPVTASVELDYTVANVLSCRVCPAKFGTLSELNRHEAKALHYPFKIKEHKNNCLVFMNKSSSKIIINNYLEAKNHVLGVLNLGSTRTVTLAVQNVLLVGKLPVKTLPPPEDQDTLRLIETDIETYDRYKKFLGNISGSKAIKLKATMECDKLIEIKNDIQTVGKSSKNLKSLPMATGETESLQGFIRPPPLGWKFHMS